MATVFGTPDGFGNASNTALVSMDGPSSTPAGAPPNDHPNTWPASIVGICTAGVSGVSDVLATARLQGAASTSRSSPPEWSLLRLVRGRES